MVANEVKLMALAEVIRIQKYIDDWLMRAKYKTAMPREYPQIRSHSSPSLFYSKEKI